MRILIVNGYDNANLEKFQHFQYTVMKYLAEQKELIDTENEFYVRNRDTIEDFLYEVESSYVKREAAQKFDQLDLVFVIGDSYAKPWGQRMVKVLTLLRMCLRVSKLLFASGFGMQALVYLSASNIEKHIHLLNENGGKLADLKTLDSSKVQQNDMFLESTSGDLYAFNYETSEWVPKTNVGLHYRRAAQEFQSIGKYIVKAPIYKPKPLVQSVFKNKNTETVVQIKNIYLHHWAFKDVPARFVVPLLNQWDVHQFQINNLNKKFISIAESDEGPSIIEYYRAFSCMFEIDHKYPITDIFLRNFINHSMYHIKMSSNVKHVEQIENFQTHGVQSSTLLDLLKINQTVQPKKKTLQLMQDRGINGILAQSQSRVVDQLKPSMHSPSQQQSTIAHVGFTLNKRVPIQPVEFNSVAKRKIKMDSHARRHRFESVKESYNNKEQTSESEESSQEVLAPVSNPKMREIRKLLHPEISKQCLQSDVWIPGHLSEQKPSERKPIRVVFHQRVKSQPNLKSQNSTNQSQDEESRVKPKKVLNFK